MTDGRQGLAAEQFEGNRSRLRAVAYRMLGSASEDAFLAASRGGDFGALLALLDPAVVLRADAMAVAASASAQARGAPRLAPELHGADAVVETFSGRARGAQPALIDGAAGAVWAAGGVVRSAFMFTIEDGKITGIDVVADPVRIAALDVEVAKQDPAVTVPL